MKAVSAARMRRIDRAAIERFGLSPLVLMENAGSACADETARLGGGVYRRALVLCGSGNNGGDGFVAARHLSNRGLKVSVFTAGDPATSPARTNRRILERMSVPVARVRATAAALRRLREAMAVSDVVVDALYGTGLNRPVEGPARLFIEAVNSSGKPVVSIDVPSGMNADSGRPMGCAVRAILTVALAAPKKGFRHGRRYTGRVVTRDISIPRTLLK